MLLVLLWILCCIAFCIIYRKLSALIVIGTSYQNCIYLSHVVMQLICYNFHVMCKCEMRVLTR